jgi:hypothetical protein
MPITAPRNLAVGAISELGAGCPNAPPKIWVASKTTANNDNEEVHCIAALHDCVIVGMSSRSAFAVYHKACNEKSGHRNGPTSKTE